MLCSRFARNFIQPCSVIKLIRRSSSSCSKQKKCQEGKKALVTGASMGIGLQFVKSLLEHGVMNIMLSDIDVKTAEEEICKLRRQYKSACLCFVPCDAAKSDDMEKLFQCTLEMFGYIDIVCNNAGIFDESRWSTMADINVKGVVKGSLLAMSCMSKENGGKGGSVINVASILGLQGMAGSPVYNASKHAVIGLTRSLGMPYHYKKSCIRYMAICPGVTETPLISKAHKLKEKSSLAQEASRELGALPSQHVCHAGVCLIQMLNKGQSGSVWVTEGKEVYEVVIPDRLLFERRC